MTYIYPTASTIAVFLNGFHLEQAYQLQFKESAPKIPIFGYNDYTFSKVAYGRKMVQGILVVNFIFAGYLNTILDAQYNGANVPFVPRLHNYDEAVANTYSQRKLIDEIRQQVKTELPSVATEAERSARASYIASLITKNKASRDATKKALEESFTPQDFPRVIDKLPSPLDARSNGVILDLYYQDPSYTTWWIRFDNIFFYEVSQVNSQAGAEGSSDPLYEVYSFMASDRYTKLVKEKI